MSSRCGYTISMLEQPLSSNMTSLTNQIIDTTYSIRVFVFLFSPRVIRGRGQKIGAMVHKLTSIVKSEDTVFSISLAHREDQNL